MCKAQKASAAPTVLIIFGTVYLYGLERGVIEIFDLLRPNVIPHFLVSRTTQRLNLPVLAEIKRRDFHYTFLSDHKGWARLEKPKSVLMLWSVCVAFVKANLDALRASRHADILYVPGVLAFYNAIFTCIFFRLRRKQVIYHFHDLITSHSSSLRMITLLVTDFIHNTELSYQAVLGNNPFILNRNNHIIPHPIGKRVHVRKDLTLQSHLDGKRNILFIGRVSKHKGIDILVKAVNQIDALYADVVLHIVGECQDSDFKSKLHSLIDESHCEIKQWGYRDDVLYLLERAYVYVQPTPPSISNESFGISTLEAMSLGVPSVCFMSGALAEIVVHKQTGLICQNESPGCLAEALQTFLESPEFRNYCGEQARLRYINVYNPTRVKSLWYKVIKDKNKSSIG